MRNIVDDLFNSNNEFFNLTKDSKRLTHILLSSFILPSLFLAIAGILSQIILFPLLFGNPSNISNFFRDIYNLIVMTGTTILIIALWMKLYEGRSFSTLGFTTNKASKKYLTGFVLGFIMNSSVVAIIALLGGIEISTESSAIIGINSIGFVLMFLIGFIIQGASEEIIARGWMFQVIGARYLPWLGMLISTFYFTLLHLGNYGINYPSVINLILVSILLCLFVMNDGTLWSACAWHSAWNWTMGNIYGLSVSGSGEKTSIFDLNTVGNELIGGGGFGPEGSLVTSFVIFIGIIVLSNKILKKKQLRIPQNGTISIDQPE